MAGKSIARKQPIAPVQWFRLTMLAVAVGFTGCAPGVQNADVSPNAESANAGSANTGSANAADRPQIVATSSVLCDLTRQIAQDTVALTCLLQPNQDPHVYEPAPSDRRAIEDADLVLYGGYGYEPSLDKIIEATSTDSPKVAVFEAAVPNPLLGEAHNHEHGHDHEADTEQSQEAIALEDHADDHDHAEEEAGGATAASADADHDHSDETVAEGEVPDPHIWHNAQHGSKIAETIAQQLAGVAPEHAEQYQQNAAAIASELTQLDSWIKTQVATVPQSSRQLITTHDSFQYFADAYGFEIKGALEGLSTEQRPSAARLTELVETVKEAGVAAIFAETTTNRSLIETVAKDADVAVAEQPLYVEGPGGDDTSAPTYQHMFVANTCTVVNALGGECDEASAPVQ
ncbi:MAG: hypothetical protein Kow00121_56400 [Elainellaceae cyanobacterium]